MPRLLRAMLSLRYFADAECIVLMPKISPYAPCLFHAEAMLPVIFIMMPRCRSIRDACCRSAATHAYYFMLLLFSLAILLRQPDFSYIISLRHIDADAFIL